MATLAAALLIFVQPRANHSSVTHPWEAFFTFLMYL